MNVHIASKEVIFEKLIRLCDVSFLKNGIQGRFPNSMSKISKLWRKTTRTPCLSLQRDVCTNNDVAEYVYVCVSVCVSAFVQCSGRKLIKE